MSIWRGPERLEAYTPWSNGDRYASKEEAVALGKQFMALHANVLGPSYDGECEVRQLFDAVDCAPSS